MEIPIFNPSGDDLKNFQKYIEDLEKKHPIIESGAILINPPPGLKYDNGYDSQNIMKMKIKDPVTQYIYKEPKPGLFSVNNMIYGQTTVRNYKSLNNSVAYATPEHNDPIDLEKIFWKQANQEAFPAPIYAAGLDGCLTKANEILDLSNLGTILDDCPTKFQGIHTPMLYFGQWRTLFPIHTEDSNLYSINFLHTGAPKIWYVVPPAYGKKLENKLDEFFPKLKTKCPGYICHKTILVDPSLLKSWEIPYQRIQQMPGQIVVTMPFAYHMGYNEGYNVAESVNFATNSWIEYGKWATKCSCSNAVNINMEPFIKKYQPNIYGKWKAGREMGRHPADPTAKPSIVPNGISEPKATAEDSNSSSEEEIEHRETVAKTLPPCRSGGFICKYCGHNFTRNDNLFAHLERFPGRCESNIRPKLRDVRLGEDVIQDYRLKAENLESKLLEYYDEIQNTYKIVFNTETIQKVKQRCLESNIENESSSDKSNRKSKRKTNYLLSNKFKKAKVGSPDTEQLSPEIPTYQFSRCNHLGGDIPKCWDCTHGKSECRFIGYRKVIFDPNEGYQVFGFPSPDLDPTQEDLDIWYLKSKVGLEKDSAKTILKFIGPDFCQMLNQEKIQTHHYNDPDEGLPVIWKRISPTEPCREICDTCKTSLFNTNFVCRQCGFSSCVNCFEEADDNLCKKCNQISVQLAQIIPSKVLASLEKSFHQLLEQNEIPHSCLPTTKPTTRPGQILEIIYEDHENRMNDFEQALENGNPIIITNVPVDYNLWSPNSFLKHHTAVQNIELLDATKRDVSYSTHTLAQFWEGFIHSHMLIGKYKPLLKIKDWPSDEDFQDIFPAHFANYFATVPFKAFASRDGPFNLIKYLPQNFVVPDIGPKMYSAYGGEANHETGTTQLHLDMCDAVNVMVYSSINGTNCIMTSGKRNLKKNMTALLQKCGCENNNLMKLKDMGNRLPGALWHIFKSEDADKIRKYLDKDYDAKGDGDPIHDQTNYLTGKDRENLRKSGVIIFEILQYTGDAIFIPAGAPHQVLNVADCIKVATDFVSPHRVSQCLKLIQEFRRLPQTHTNKEDKLQAKNIVFHSVNAAVSSLTN